MSHKCERQGIGKLTARNNYYYESHKSRWRKRYLQPFLEPVGQTGVIDGVRWLNA